MSPLVPERLRLQDGGTLAYGRHGAGPALVLVAGLGGVAAAWELVLPALAERFTVVLHDHRGTGASSRCDRPYSIASIADDVLALMDHLDLAQALFVGHSTGGAVGQHLAIHAAPRLSRAVLSATWARHCAYMRRLFALRLAVLNEMGAGAYRELGELLLSTPAWIAAQPDTPPTPGAETALGIENIRRRIGAVLAHDMQDALPRIACPTLILTAEDDMVVPAFHSAALARAIPSARLVTLRRGGHLIQQTGAPEFLSAVTPFLQGLA